MTAVTSPAAAQRPTPEDIDEMFPLSTTSPQYYPMPYFKWASGSPISVLVVTGGQKTPCVDIIAGQLRREVGRIRGLVTELRNLRDPELIEWIPKAPVDAPLLIGLDMIRPAQQAMAQYAATLKPRAEYYGSDRASPLVFAQGFGIENSHIVYAYRSSHDVGLMKISEDTCRRSRWDLAGLMSELGGVKFRVINSRWGREIMTAELDRFDDENSWTGFMERLFLKALYTCPGSPASETCLKRTVKALAADPSIFPPQ